MDLLSADGERFEDLKVEMEEFKPVFRIWRVNRKTGKQILISRQTRVIMNCPHKESKYYAKGMCRSCYHNYGRSKKAYLCPHTDSLHYAKGLCKKCY